MQKKIALIGAAGVGKTSLVRRFVSSLFDDKYLTTIGVKVEKKVVQAAGIDVTLMLWDIAGAEEHFSIPSAYIRGAAGYLLVLDGTRPDTIVTAEALNAQIARDVGRLPHVVVINKADLPLAMAADDQAVRALGGLSVLVTSAKTGDGVERAFVQLAEAVVSDLPR